MHDYVFTKGRMYRGPVQSDSSFVAMHAVSIMVLIEKEGEMLFKIKSTHTERVGTLKIFMEVKLI